MESAGTGHEPDHEFESSVIRTMYDLEAALRRYPELYIRYSAGPIADSRERSVDHESGLELPGLSVNPLQPEDWWHRPIADWLSRQVCRYRHVQEQHPDGYAWVLTGSAVGRGPDCEPLIGDPVPVARLSEQLLAEADDRYRSRFEAGRRE